MMLSALLHEALRGLHVAAAPFIDLIAPDRCGSCGAEGALLCVACRADLLDGAAAPLLPPPSGVLAAAALGSYASGLGEALRTLKFHGVPRLAAPLGAALAPVIARVAHEINSAPPLLVPIPTDPARRRERGFDHALQLATAAADGGGVIELLERTRAVEPLHGLDRSERRRALDQAIAVRAGVTRGISPSTTLILVDDIWTSGATFEAAARALHAAGFTRIGAVAVAREPLGGR